MHERIISIRLILVINSDTGSDIKEINICITEALPYTSELGIYNRETGIYIKEMSFCSTEIHVYTCEIVFYNYKIVVFCRENGLNIPDNTISAPVNTIYSKENANTLKETLIYGDRSGSYNAAMSACRPEIRLFCSTCFPN